MQGWRFRSTLPVYIELGNQTAQERLLFCEERIASTDSILQASRQAELLLQRIEPHHSSRHLGTCMGYPTPVDYRKICIQSEVGSAQNNSAQKGGIKVLHEEAALQVRVIEAEHAALRVQEAEHTAAMRAKEIELETAVARAEALAVVLKAKGEGQAAADAAAVQISAAKADAALQVREAELMAVLQVREAEHTAAMRAKEVELETAVSRAAALAVVLKTNDEERAAAEQSKRGALQAKHEWEERAADARTKAFEHIDIERKIAEEQALSTIEAKVAALATAVEHSASSMPGEGSWDNQGNESASDCEGSECSEDGTAC
jgi:hypothetical protein